MENATSFGAQAQTYAAARPHYPSDLFDWITAHAPQTKTVWDVGTGSGQAALSLAERFDDVYATDIDSAQISQANAHRKIRYQQATAHQSGLPDNSVDAICVATALHWFDHRLFWEEVSRVARKDALFCAWTYHRAHSDDEVHQLLLDPVLNVLEPYWSDGNRLSWRGYIPEEIAMPFEVIPTPAFSCALNWTPSQIAGFTRSWSAHKKARLDGKGDQLAELESKALADLGDSPRRFTLPMHCLAARIA